MKIKNYIKTSNIYPLLLLLSVIILFSLLGTSYNFEGYTEQEPIPIPQCPPGSGCGGGHNGPHGPHGFGGGKGNNSDYILKTQIVPPVCPMCPPYICDNDASGNNSKDAPVSKDISVSKSGRSSNEHASSFKTNTETTTTTQQNNSPQGNSPQGNSSQGNSSQGNSGGFLGGLTRGSSLISGNSGTDISESQQEINKLKIQLKEMKKNGGSCQPCPACERCPEPSFDCKKVPNYRSTAVGNYLPMPILNDFSQF